MDPILMGFVAFACSMAGIGLGLYLRNRLPGHHLSDESKDAVKMGAGLLATLTALVLGLLVSSAKNTFDTMSSGLTQSGAKVIMFDRTLAQYGPETQEIRQTLRNTVARAIRMIWPEDATSTVSAASLKAFDSAPAGLETIQAQLRRLTPQTDAQRALQTQAMQLVNEVAQSRWLAIEQAQAPLPTAFLIVLLFWLTVFFITLGLFAPPNGTVITVMVVCAMSVGGAIYLVGEMSRPLQGTMKVSSAPLVKALEHLGKD